MTEAAWIVGFHAVQGLLKSGRPVEVIWIQAGRRDRRTQEICRLARERGIEVRFVPVARLKAVADGVAHNGCAARACPVPLRKIEDCLAHPEEAGRLLILDDVVDPHNIGAVVRSAAAFGIDGVILCGPSVPPLGGAAAKSAAGLLQAVPLIKAKVAGDVLRTLAEAGYWIFGADAEGTAVQRIEAPDRWALCVGSEERGLRAKTRHQVDEWVSIPMAPGVESLNVSVATGILLHALTAALPKG